MENHLNPFQELLGEKFGMIEGGTLEWYLGISINKLEDGRITLDHSVYLDQKLN